MNLNFDCVVIELERKAQWCDAADYLYNQWRKLPEEKNILLCAGAELWHLICYYDQPPFNKTIDFDDFDLGGYMKKLQEITNAGLEYFPHDPDFLVLFGYFMKVQPFWFVSDRNPDVTSIQKRGQEMLEEAYFLSPNDPDIFAIYWHWKSQDWTNPEQLCQWGDGVISGYFRAVLGISSTG